jgi:hypothetical protein
MIQTEHPIEYLEDERTENWSGFPNPLKWMLGYVSRNKIPVEFFDYPMDKFVNGETAPYIRLTFRSKRQHDCFLHRANGCFPFVEFI